MHGSSPESKCVMCKIYNPVEPDLLLHCAVKNKKISHRQYASPQRVMLVRAVMGNRGGQHPR